MYSSSNYNYMAGSQNRGTPKSSILVGFYTSSTAQGGGGSFKIGNL